MTDDLQPQVPQPVLYASGSDDARLTNTLVALTLDEADGSPMSLTLRFLDAGSTGEDGRTERVFRDDTLLALGDEITIGMGPEDDSTTMFQGLVTAVEESVGRGLQPEFVVSAEDRLQVLRMGRHTAVREDVSLRDLVEEMADLADLTAQVDDLNQHLPLSVQLNESNLAYLRRVLDDADAALQVVGVELHAVARSSISRGEVSLHAETECIALRATADLAHQVTETTLHGFDVAQGRRFGVTGQTSSLGPGEGSTGGEILTNKLGQRSEQIDVLVPADEDEARALAEAAYQQRARSFVTLDGTTSGNPALRVGAHLVLTGMSDRFNNTYRVTAATHRWERGIGYETDFQAECAYLGLGG